jgi:hypothetical protein
MSRGPGWIQSVVLERLEQLPNGDTDAVCTAYDCYGDSPSRSQVESARRALRGMERVGTLVSAPEPGPFGVPRRVYRLPTAAVTAGRSGAWIGG